MGGCGGISLESDCSPHSPGGDGIVVLHEGPGSLVGDAIGGEVGRFADLDVDAPGSGGVDRMDMC